MKPDLLLLLMPFVLFVTFLVLKRFFPTLDNARNWIQRLLVIALAIALQVGLAHFGIVVPGVQDVISQGVVGLLTALASMGVHQAVTS